MPSRHRFRHGHLDFAHLRQHLLVPEDVLLECFVVVAAEELEELFAPLRDLDRLVVLVQAVQRFPYLHEGLRALEVVEVDPPDTRPRAP